MALTFANTARTTQKDVLLHNIMDTTQLVVTQYWFTTKTAWSCRTSYLQT